MIEVQGLSKRFGDLQVLTDISATFEDGKINQIHTSPQHLQF